MSKQSASDMREELFLLEGKGLHHTLRAKYLKRRIEQADKRARWAKERARVRAARQNRCEELRKKLIEKNEELGLLPPMSKQVMLDEVI